MILRTDNLGSTVEAREPEVLILKTTKPSWKSELVKVDGLETEAWKSQAVP